jgi:GNAT superfamily N-acetyltransferase
MTLEDAAEAFVRGFSFTKAYAKPYVAEQIGRSWLMRDDPVRAKGRLAEWVLIRTAPRDAAELLRTRVLPRCAVSYLRALDEDREQLRTGFRDLGYRMLHSEALMFHRLQSVASPSSKHEVLRVTEPGQAELLRRAARTRQILPEHLSPAETTIRQYMALVDGEPAGWVRSIAAGPAMYCRIVVSAGERCSGRICRVRAAFRRRGLARSLMARMLQDDRRAGGPASVLLASKAGATLYPSLGYEELGELLVFFPPQAG